MTNKSFFVDTSYRLAAYIEQELKMQRGHHFSFVRVVPSYKVLTLWLVINPTYTKKIVAMTKELSQAARLEKGSFIRAEWGGEGVVELQIPKPKYLWTAPRLAKLPQQMGVKTAVGLDTENKAAVADFANPVTAHALVAGLSGSGKTNLVRVLVFMLAVQNRRPEEVRFLLFDVADTGLAWEGFDNLPHLVHGVVSDTKTALDAMGWLTGELERRSEARCTMPRLFVFVDEIQELAQDKRFVEPLEKLARRSRKWGINLVLATQRPVKESLGSMNVKANLGLRLVGKVTSGHEAAWATDLPESGAETLCDVGDFLLVKPGGHVQRIATPLLTDEDIARLPTNGRDRVDFPKPADEDDDGKAAGDFDALETVIGLLAAHYGKGRPWLKDTLEAEGRSKPGSDRARRLLAWGREVSGLLHRYGHGLCLID